MPPNVIYHPNVVPEDLPRLNRQFPGKGPQIIAQINGAVQDTIASRGVPEHDMEPPYKGWYRKKFFNTASPSPGMRPDLRMIFQFSDDRSELRILAIGKRIPGHPDDIYAIHATRSQTF